jgi:tripartite-type tricarboxylate transporter receptor subunit TctC
MNSPHSILRRQLYLAVLGLAATFSTSSALAQVWDYPNKTIRIIVPFTPGGVADNSARIVAENLGNRLKQSVIVENKPGGGGNIGNEFVAKAAPDGYTLLLGFDSTLVINPLVFKNIGFDPIKDFAPIAKLGDSTLILVAAKNVPANTLQELIGYAKRMPTLAFGSGGAGSTAHLAGEMLNTRAGISLQHIPYKGGSQALIDLAGGHLPLLITAVASSVGHIKNGQIKPIAVLSAHRSAALPDVPTFSEAGIPGFDVPTWAGLLAPANTPATIINKLHTEIAATLKDPSVRAKYAALGLEPVGNTPAEFGGQIRKGLSEWEPVVKKLNLILN